MPEESGQSSAFGSKGRLVIESPMAPSNGARVCFARPGEVSLG